MSKKNKTQKILILKKFKFYKYPAHSGKFKLTSITPKFDW